MAKPTRKPRKTAQRATAASAPTGLTHFNAAGDAHMVAVSAKPETHRVAVAESRITMAPATARAIAAGQIGKGDVLAVARLAAIGATKRSAELIPLCHPLRITGVDVALRVDPTSVHIVVTVQAFDRTGVEMEALTGAAVAALTIYDMCKAIDRGMEMGPTRLLEKQGGRSGTWQRSR